MAMAFKVGGQGRRVNAPKSNGLWLQILVVLILKCASFLLTIGYKMLHDISRPLNQTSGT